MSGNRIAPAPLQISGTSSDLQPQTIIEKALSASTALPPDIVSPLNALSPTKSAKLFPSLRMRSVSSPPVTKLHPEKKEKSGSSLRPPTSRNSVASTSLPGEAGLQSVLNVPDIPNISPISPNMRRKGGMAPIPDANQFSNGTPSDGASCPRTIIASSKVMSLPEFILNDTKPRKQRKILHALQKFREGGSHDDSASKTAPIPIKKLSKPASVSHTPAHTPDKPVKLEVAPKKKATGALGKLNNLLSKSRKKKKTPAGLFHMLILAIHDVKTSLACGVLEEISISTMKKKAPIEVNNAFLMAMVNCMEPVCMIMLEKGFPPNINSPIFNYGEEGAIVFPSYFLLAVSFGLDNVVRTMVKRCDPNVDWYGLTPLQLACCKGNASVVNVLLDTNADMGKGLSLGEYALLRKMKSAKALEVLRTKKRKTQSGGGLKSHILTEDYLRNTTFLPIELALLCGQIEMTKSIIPRMEPKALKNAKFCLFFTTDIELLITFVRLAASIEVKDHKGSTPLQMAARNGSFDCVVTLCVLKSKIDEKGENGWTALHEAVSQRQTKISQYLVMVGASKSATTINGETPSDVGIKVGLSPTELEGYFDFSSQEPSFRETERSINATINKLNTAVDSVSSPTNFRKKQQKKSSNLPSFMQRSPSRDSNTPPRDSNTNSGGSSGNQTSKDFDLVHMPDDSDQPGSPDISKEKSPRLSKTNKDKKDTGLLGKLLGKKD